jgi:O-antigen ligase
MVMRTPESLAIGRLLGWTALLATVMVMPWAAYDPINVPKLAVISVGGFMALGALLANRAEFMKKQYRLVLIFGVAFIIDLTIVLLVSGTNFYQEFFGTFGRATGYVAYVALASLLMVAAVTASSFALKRFTWSLLAAGLISIVYGIVQALKLDPIKWVNQYSPVIGFLGNPNFQSSFVGFSGVMAFAMLLGKEVKATWRAGYVAYVVAAAYVIKETHSQQGFLVLMGGIAVVAFIWISRSKIKVLTIPSLVVGLAGVVLVTLGSLNTGPLASVLYKASVTYRGDYWRAGWKMSLEHPFFGVGLDSFGDWYRRARTVEATLRRGPDIVSNAAHNVLLDLSSNGGFPLLAIYVFMMVLVISASVKVIRRHAGFDPVFSGLVAVWVAYQAQSIISLNQLGLAVWGWIISGLIIGYEINTREVEVVQRHAPKGKSASAMAAQKVMPATAVGIFVGLLVGLALGVPTLNTASKYKTGLESGDAATVQKIASIWPQDASRSAQIALILNENKLPEQALAVVQDAKTKFPDSYDVWKVLASLPNAPAEDIAAAKAQMKRLDPHNPDLK